MAEFRFTRGDRYALTCPLAKDGAVFDTTSGGWTVTATLAQGDTVRAGTTVVEDPLKPTLTVQNTPAGCAVTICNSILLSEGLYSLEVSATDGVLRYTWPSWAIRVVEPTRV